MRLIEQIVVLITIIPATQFFRSTLTGLGGGITDSVSSNALSMGAGVAMGAIGGFMGKGSRGSSGNGNSDRGRINNAEVNGNFSVKKVDGLDGSNKTSLTNQMKDNSSNENKHNRIEAAHNNKFNLKDKTHETIKSAVSLKDNISEGLNKPSVKTAGKIAKGIGKATIGTGVAIGGSAVGNKAIAGAGGFMAVEGIESTVQPIKDSLSNVSLDNFRDTYGCGCKYYSDLGDSIQYKYDSKLLNQETGISDVEESLVNGQKCITATYDMGNKIVDKEVLNDMRDAFANNDADKIKYYKSFGVERCVQKDNNTMQIAYNSKNNLGIISARTTSNGKNTIIVKDKMSNSDMNFSIPKYKPSQESNYKKNNSNVG
ncbi:hypothetical protein BFS06_12205 [Clostridium perfringens]|uniref:Uncharacterized protein n=1 Tax=Clostridium perfringens TaxID=1502 RepID=A0A140GR08_CLOPF|nr:hypothetical protein [Clostridium perfringens]AMN30967.1 hypothetical protein JFP838_pA0051 [Clostridium perfringens]TBX14963.1 hypothetical protein BFS06_12205 [Clostridium perfringens]